MADVGGVEGSRNRRQPLGTEAPKNIDEITEGIMGGGCCPLEGATEGPSGEQRTAAGRTGEPASLPAAGGTISFSPPGVCPSP